MKAITISVVNNGYLVQGYTPRNCNQPFEVPLADNLYVFNNIEDLQKQLPSLLEEKIKQESCSNIVETEPAF